MFRKLLYPLLAAEAVFCIIFCLCNFSSADILVTASSFPFEQIGSLLRALSLTGDPGSGLAPGNGLALAIYVGLCLLPSLFLLDLVRRSAFKPEDSLLGLLSLILFPVLYLMINPSSLEKLFSAQMTVVQDSETLFPIYKAILGGTVWSVVIGYLILRTLRLFYRSGQAKLWGYLEKLLALLAGLFVLAAFGSCFGELLSSISSLRAGNTDGGGLSADYIFLVLRFIVDVLPWLASIVTVHFLFELISQHKREPYSKETVLAAGRLSRFCVFSLAAVILSNLSYHLLQLLCARILRNISGIISIPVVSICFVLTVLLFTRLLAENHQLKSDNELFI